MTRRVISYGLVDEPQPDGRVFKVTSATLECGHAVRVAGAKTDAEARFRDEVNDGIFQWHLECPMCNPQPK